MKVPHSRTLTNRIKRRLIFARTFARIIIEMRNFIWKKDKLSTFYSTCTHSVSIEHCVLIIENQQSPKWIERNSTNLFSFFSFLLQWLIYVSWISIILHRSNKFVISFHFFFVRSLIWIGTHFILTQHAACWVVFFPLRFQWKWPDFNWFMPTARLTYRK